MPKEVAGVMRETVGDLLGDAPPPVMQFVEQEGPLAMPRLDTTHPEPPVGIHFGMTEEDYHRLPCFSQSYARALLASPTLFWADSWLNEDREEEDEADEKTHRIVGRAYHAMILEGPRHYGERFYPAPDPKAHPKALRTVEQIKQALEARDIKPVAKVDVPGQEGKTKAATKPDWIAQLVQADRSVEVWDDIVAKAERMAAGRAMLSVADDRRIRVAARMIAQEPELSKAFTGGVPEVTLVWRDPRQGVLCKARVDYLKLKMMVDLKSFANRDKRSIRNAILHAIASNRYALQPAIYLQAADEVRKLVRAHGASAIYYHDTADGQDNRRAAQQEFAMRWAAYEDPDRWMWVFQQKGDAPVTRGYWYSTGSTSHTIMCGFWVTACREFRRNAELYGVDPWLDLAELDEIADGDIPSWGLDI
jgi:hypothetical protein